MNFENNELWIVLKQMNSDIVFRRATVDDYRSVLSIVDDVCTEHGTDYLPTLYHVLLQTKRFVFYVAEMNGRLVRTSEH